MKDISIAVDQANMKLMLQIGEQEDFEMDDLLLTYSKVGLTEKVHFLGFNLYDDGFGYMEDEPENYTEFLLKKTKALVKSLSKIRFGK